jgi:hypothetical protein
MARRPKRTEPLYWNDVVDRDTMEKLGSYAVDGRMIIVRSAKGWEKSAMSSAGGANEGLARLILSEGPPPGWR